MQKGKVTGKLLCNKSLTLSSCEALTFLRRPFFPWLFLKKGIKQFFFIFLLINFKVFFLYFKNSFTKEKSLDYIFFDYYLRGKRTET